jgi:myo-inositol-1(or 4)-monophosphatase
MAPYDFIIKKIKKAGEILTSGQSNGFKTMNKGGDPRDITTSIDMEINEFFIKEIKQSFSDHGIYSEEAGDIQMASEYKWVIDPIDGSANFSRGIPHFAICLGLLHFNTPIAGAVYNPITRELFSFKKGQGAFLNGESICVSEISDLSQAHVFFHAGRKEELRDWGGESYRRLLASVRKTNNFASSSLDTCFVAGGRIEANIYGTLSTIDIAPAIGILTEAGGLAVDAFGASLTLSLKPQKIFIANNEKIFQSLLKLLY